MLKRLAVTLIFTCVLGGAARAETMYVTDTLQVAVRSGMGLEYKILRYVRSNEPVEVLQTEGEYAQLRLSNGSEGWILRRYLTTETPKPRVIERLEEKIQKMSEKKEKASVVITELEEQKAALEKTSTQQAATISELETAFSELKNSCANVSRLRQDYADLKTSLEHTQQLNNELFSENEQLRRKAYFWWFVVGGAFALFFFVVGYSLQSLRGKKKGKSSLTF